jgi:hypothetical protein
MLGCLKFFGFFILGLIYLVFLAAAPRTALILGAASLAGYFFWSKRRKIRAAKAADRAAKEAEEKRLQAIILARQREDLYEYDPSIQPSHKRSTNNIFEHPGKWAKSIQERLEDAQKRLEDAKLVFNDDVDRLTEYRRQLQADLLPKYEIAIKPFFDELLVRDQDIPTPQELKFAIDFRYPNDLQPAALDKDLNNVLRGYSRSITNSLSGKELTKLQKADAASIAITTAIHAIGYLFTTSQQRTKLEKVQADVDAVCEQISGAIRTYGTASEGVKHTKLVHEVAANHTKRNLETAIHLSHTGKNLSELDESKQRVIEDCYRGGQSLKKIMQQDIIKPISRSN